MEVKIPSSVDNGAPSRKEKTARNIFFNPNGVTAKIGLEYKTYIAPIVTTVVLLVIGQIINPGFASIDNIGNILAIASILCIGSAGQTLIIISGGDGIDLSVGALMSMGAVIASGALAGANMNIPWAIFVLVVIGAGFGLMSGSGVWWVGVPPLVMTLAMGAVVEGFTMAVCQGRPFGAACPLVLAVGGDRLFGPIRWLLIVAIFSIVVLEFVLRKSRYGNALFLCGNNRVAAKICGIKVRNVVLMTYAISGIIGSIAGLFLLSSVGTAQMQMGEQYTLLSIAAVVLGGTQLTGGKGSYIGTALGAVVLVALTNVLITIGMAPGTRLFITGVVLIVILLSYSRGSKLRQ